MRTARLNIPGVTYHLIWRFVDHTWFFTDDEERSYYLRLLGRALADSDWRCLAYALMSNHIHIAAIGGARPFEFWSKAVNSPFARWMNDRHGRLGPVFADRAKDIAVASSREGELLAYIHNNPVRANLVEHPRDSAWTSHPAYACLAPAPSWLHVSEGLLRSGFCDPGHFDNWVATTPGESGVMDVERVRRELRARGTLQTATPSAALVPIVRRPFTDVRPDPRLIVQMVAELSGAEASLVKSGARTAPVVSVRRVCAHLALVVGVSGSDIAAAMNVTPAAVSKARRQTLDAEEMRTYQLALEWLQIEIADVSKNRSAGPNENEGFDGASNAS